MKKTSHFLLIGMVLIMAFISGCSSDSSSPLLTVTASIQTSSASEALATVNPPNEIILTFSESLNLTTVQGNVSLQIVKTGGLFVSVNPTVEVTVDAQKPTQVSIRSKDGSLMPSGEEFVLVVGSGVKAASGKVLPQEYVRYFATDYNLSLRSIPELGNTRTTTWVISDIHLGDQRSIDKGYGWFIKNRDKLVSFLSVARQWPHLKELVIAGDMFDEWVAPMEYDAFNGSTESGFVDAIVAANRPVIDAFNAIIQDGNIKVVYVPGNHDMLVTSADIQRIFPGISEARDAQGLGAYTPTDLTALVVEHGHRYDFFNAPDPISNRDITKTTSILSPGFFVTKIAASSDIEKGVSSFYRDGLSAQYTSSQPGYYITYWAAWQLIMSQKPVKESWDAKIIKTGIDGYTEAYAIYDLIPHHDSSSDSPLDVLLYKDIVNTWWDQRQTANKVPIKLLAEVAIAAGAINPALDAQSIVQYFLNTDSNKRIVVFGHTHDAGLFSTLNHKLQWSVYANSGTWVDNSKVSCTFVSIIPKKENGATTDTITVYQYVDDQHMPTTIKSSAIRN
jgi:UDP-2,3-diacylglucosamine pyrophosphatase LpxH